MTDSTPARKRRHILSSINTDEAADMPTSTTAGHDETDHNAPSRDMSPGPDEPRKSAPDDKRGDDMSRARRSRLRLKSSKSRRSRHRHDDEETPSSSRSSRHHRRHRHHHRSPTPPNPYEPPPLDPEAAFRESLFDAMADDEGAAYWESVYGQPIHVYSNSTTNPAGELEQMTDEEYAAHVRQKMWEKTHAGLLEERARRDEQRKRAREEERHARKLQQEMEQSLRRGEERRQKRRWAEQWEEYSHAWSKGDTVVWPVDGGERKDINDTEVRAFFVHGLGLEDLGEQAFVAKLREERLRWHPDKMQQRFGAALDEHAMRNVTAVFQIIDKLWGDIRR